MTPAPSFDAPRARLTRMIEAQLDAPWSAYLRPCIPRLVELVEDTRGLRPQDLQIAVRRILTETCRYLPAIEGSPRDPHQRLEQHVQLIARRLERLRRVSFDTGTWSDLPVTPLMCG